MKSDLDLHSSMTADASIVLPVIRQRATMVIVMISTCSWYPIDPYDRAVWYVRMSPMLDCLVLCYPPSRGRALCSCLAEFLMIDLR
jgi:uncharacterized membrane protein YjdF